MAYVGTPIDVGNQFSSLVGKRFSGDASTTAFTLDVRANSALDIEVFVENVRQDPNSAYTVDGTTLTFTASPPSGTNNIYVVHQAPTVASVSPTAGSVTASSFDNSVISGHTALAATPATTDEFLISDAGTIKRVDYSHIGNTPTFFVKLSGAQTIGNNSNTKVTFDSEVFDSDNAFASNKFTVPSGKGGKYYIGYGLNCSGLDDGESIQASIFKNGSTVNFGFAGQFSPAGSQEIKFTSFAILDLSAADYIELFVQHFEGANMDLNASNTFLTGFRITGV